MKKHMRVYRVELLGTRLDDYAYVRAHSPTEAKSLVRKKLRELNGEGISLPRLKSSVSSYKEMVQEENFFSATNEKGGGEAAITRFRQSPVLFDFDDFRPRLDTGK